ncbi:hypothetical protein [Piscibacillus halophilus]|uniref:Uncharacterized protein n=1 Tax=Piscibacillus halophilus TaxID=571933 RepID=A0A1H9BA98_9BACI|nr:hypothetical protein [Piscibacillus halophilus]SEP85178.1 hypothetical protein SAMN05216362_103160 [Piscibacillus halophilus]
MKWLKDLEKILLEIGKHTEEKNKKEYDKLLDWEKQLSKDEKQLEDFGKKMEEWFKE